MLDLYDEGTADNAEAAVAYRKQPKTSMGMIKYGVADVRTKMRDVGALMRATMEDYATAREAKKIDHAQYQSFIQTWFAWSRFYDRFDGLPGVWMLHRDATWEEAESYRQKALFFRKLLQDKGHKVTSQEKVAEKARSGVLDKLPGISLEPRMLTAGWPWWKWGLLIGGAGAVGYGVYRLVKPKKPTLTSVPPEEAA